jgi:ABC-type dipeptide/oligopeptide/nickel transport system permease component
MIWSLPGDPVEIICPPSICTGGEELAARWNLDQGPWGFYTEWVSSALQFEFGDSWRVLTGKPVLELMEQTIPNTLLLIVLALIPITVGSVLGAFQKPSKRWDSVLVFLNVWPVVVLALLAAAIVELNFAGADDDGFGYWVRMLAAALTLGVADGALSGSILGNRSMFEQENQQRYVGISLLRGESNFSNTLPNLAGALVGQYRSRVVQLLSGAVIVEVIVRVDGFGALLWRGTLLQDFGVVLAAATTFATLSSALLFFQAVIEILQNLHQRRSPQIDWDEVGA